jgi:ZIP family zinc transporter
MTDFLGTAAMAAETAAAAAGTAGGASLEAVGYAALLGLAATVALPIGALLGIYARPSQRVVAMVMAFGSGALIEALALDLAYDGAEALVRTHHVTQLAAWAYVASGFFVGGAIFFLANRALEQQGGHLRKQSTMRAFLSRNRHRFVDLLHRRHGEHLSRQAKHGPEHLRAAEHEVLVPAVKEHHGSNAAMAIFLGALLDGIPESIVIGAQFTSFATFNPAFVVAVFLNNLPEAMSSAAGMSRSGFETKRILGMWSGLMLASAAFAGFGKLALGGASPTVTTLVNAVAGGGILAMLAATMVPEAFEEGGPSVGLATIAGFLAAFFFTIAGLA